MWNCGNVILDLFQPTKSHPGLVLSSTNKNSLIFILCYTFILFLYTFLLSINIFISII